MNKKNLLFIYNLVLLSEAKYIIKRQNYICISSICIEFKLYKIVLPVSQHLQSDGLSKYIVSDKKELQKCVSLIF